MKIYEVVIKDPKVTSKYGWRIHPIDKKKKFHYGIDLTSKIKDLNIYAIDEGIVEKTVTNKGTATTGYGNYIWVRYPRYNLSLFHAHCSEIYLKKGDKVNENTVIAKQGKTGAATGVHCHLGMTRIGSTTWIDPIDFEILDRYDLTRILKKGSSGKDVKELQKTLIAIGYNLGKTGVDGKYGSKTTAAVKKYQKKQKLKVDGKVGKDTAHALGWTYKGK